MLIVVLMCNVCYKYAIHIGYACIDSTSDTQCLCMLGISSSTNIQQTKTYNNM